MESSWWTKGTYPKPTRFVVVLRWPVLKLRDSGRVVVQGEVTKNLNWVASLEIEGRKAGLEVVGQSKMERHSRCFDSQEQLICPRPWLAYFRLSMQDEEELQQAQGSLVTRPRVLWCQSHSLLAASL